MEISKINEINDQFENDEQLSQMEKYQLIESLYNTCKDHEEPAVRARIINNYAVALFYNGESEKSHKFAIEALKIANSENLIAIQMKVYNLLGNLNSFLGRYAIALDYYHQSLRLTNQLEKSGSLSSLLNNIAIIYSIVKMRERSLHYFKEAQKFSKKEHNYKVFFLTTYNIISEALENNDVDDALTNTKAFSDMLKFKKDIVQYKALWMLIQGKLAKHNREYDPAMDYLAEALVLFEADDDYAGITDVHLLMGKIMYEKGEYDKAMTYNLMVCDYATRSEDIEIERDARIQISEVADHVPMNEIIQSNYKRLVKLDEQLLNNLYTLSVLQIEEKLDIELKNEMERNTERLLENMRFIYEVSKDISKELEYDALIEIIIRKLVSFMKFDALVIGLYDSEKKCIRNRITYSENEIKQSYDVPVDNKSSMGSWVIRNNREYYTGSLTHMTLEDFEPIEVNFPDINVPYETIYYTPLVNDEEIIGVFSIQKYEINGFDHYQLDMIRAIASYISIAVANALKTKEMQRLNEQLDVISKLDGLSNLFNRYALNQDIKPILKAFNEDKVAIATMMCDIDYFKEYNDFYGHVEGDRIIQNISDILKISVQNFTPYIYRYGGDEFLIIFQGHDEETVTQIAHNILRTVDKSNLAHIEKGIGERVTISVGLAFFDPHNEALDEDDLLRGADVSLYISKRKGRNQVRSTRF